jgi:hypothetical protein
VNGEDRCKTAIQTNNVEVDNRGYVYIVDRAKHRHARPQGDRQARRDRRTLSRTGGDAAGRPARV